jgi:hypothetical protein
MSPGSDPVVFSSFPPQWDLFPQVDPENTDAPIPLQEQIPNKSKVRKTIQPVALCQQKKHKILIYALMGIRGNYFQPPSERNPG